MFVRAITLSRCSALALLVAAALAAQPNDRDSKAIQQAEKSWWKAAQATRDQRLAWWRDARFGCFIHWGAYSGPVGEWNGKPFSGYAEHLMRIQKIPLKEYKLRVVAPFDPVKFNAEEWVSLIKGAGMKYLIVTAKHHDGFAMWPSKANAYNIHDATKFPRDPMRELSDACKRNGIRFGFYYSHAFDWADPDGPGNDWDNSNPGGDKQLYGGLQWYDLYPDLLVKARRYVDRKAIPQVQELVRIYHPDIMWFDTPQKLPVSEQLRVLQAVREADPNIVINGRGARDGGRQFGDYQNTGDRAAEFRPTDGDWEAIPTTNESYGYHRFDNSHKTPEFFVRLLAKAAARGGNLLLNIGPMGNGEIDPKDQAILRGIGKWMSANGDSIYGTQRTPLAPEAWGETTLKGNTLYLHVFDWPRDGKLVVGGVQDDVTLKVPARAPDAIDSVIPLTLKTELKPDPVRLISTTQANVLRAFDVQTEGKGLRFTDGKAPHAYVYEWKSAEQSVLWPARLKEEGEFEVWAKYSTGSAANAGRFAVEMGTQRVESAVEPTAKDTEPREELAAGASDVRVRALKIEGGELIRLFSVTLRPVR